MNGYRGNQKRERKDAELDWVTDESGTRLRQPLCGEATCRLGIRHLRGDVFNESIESKTILPITAREAYTKLELHGLEEPNKSTPAGKGVCNTPPLRRGRVCEKCQEPFGITVNFKIDVAWVVQASFCNAG